MTSCKQRKEKEKGRKLNKYHHRFTINKEIKRKGKLNKDHNGVTINKEIKGEENSRSFWFP
jgi:hypothetical protein